ncbi:MAG: [Fe-Fe] hydrogenase large subunit C-terminal domain-containing protein [Lentimicrobiaceae bacterium]|nr:[Fe-Fe] hydrogenase large subunit C-terminal domain-containing protein [Lentimicrobiaceae bacterium]
MNSPFISIDYQKCIKCYACIRNCAVQAISISSNEGFPTINSDRCTGCGDCVIACKINALTYYDSKPETINLIKSSNKVVAIVDPAIAAEFADIADYRKFVKMIQSIGFENIHEVAFGVDVVGKKYNELVNNFMGKYYLFSCCPVVTQLVEKYYTGLVENLVPIVNPVIATAKIMKQLYGEEIKITYIGPCVAAKMDIHRKQYDGIIDTVLTFKELRELFNHFNIKESAIEFSDFSPPYGHKGGIYPIAEGILTASGIDYQLLNSNVITSRGNKSVIETLEEIENNFEDIHKHFNLFYCDDCIMGLGMKTDKKRQERVSSLNKYVLKRMKDFNIAEWNNELKKYSDLDLDIDYAENNQKFPAVSKERKQEILKSIKKDGDKSADCGNCGFKNCDYFAEAVANKVINTSLCSTYMVESKNEYISTLNSTNEKLQKQYSDLLVANRKNVNEAQDYKDKLEDFQNLIQKLPLAIFLVDKDLKILTSNESFINILGDEVKEINEIIPGLKGADLKTILPVQVYKLFTYVINSDEDVVGRDIPLNDKLLLLNIFSIKKNRIAGGVLRDMHTPEVRSEEVVSRVTEVIDLNLNLVQKIAFLLGEAGANTEKMLNSIIESHKNQ